MYFVVGAKKSFSSHYEVIGGKKFNLYPSLPFANIIKFEEDKFTEKERRFLYSTSVDITLCSRSDEPILSIEFDGMNHGFSRNGEYVQVVPDLLREWKFDVKLKVAGQAGYPLFIVSYEGKKSIGEGSYLTVVDGIIGRYLAHYYIPQMLNEYLEKYEKNTSTMSSFEKEEYYQSLLEDVEVDANFLWNPIAKEISKYANILLHHGLEKSFSFIPLYKPELPDASIFDIFTNPRAIEEGIRAWRNIRWVGYKGVIKTPDREFSETVWVRNFEGRGVIPSSIARDVVEFILCKRVCDKYKLI